MYLFLRVWNDKSYIMYICFLVVISEIVCNCRNSVEKGYIEVFFWGWEVLSKGDLFIEV